MRIITGQFKGIRLESVDDVYLRPIDDRVKESVFNILMHRTNGAKVLDCFAGTGAIGLEALSRGADSVCFVEKERSFLNVLKKNIEKLKVEEQANVWPGDVFSTIKRLAEKEEKFDLVFIDPPYFDQVKEVNGRVQQIKGIRKPKNDEEIEKLQSADTEPLPQLILKYLNEYPILKESGLGMIRTFKKVPIQFEGFDNINCCRQQNYGDGVVSFFQVK